MQQSLFEVQPALFDGINECHTDEEAERVSARSEALSRIRRSWFGLPLEAAIERVVENRRRSREKHQKFISRRRRGRKVYRYKYVRLVSGTNLYQARPWHPVVGSINLGLYKNERDAWHAVQAWIQAGCDPCRGLPPGILPKWVKEIDGRFVAGDRRGVWFELGDWGCPVECHEAARQHLAANVTA